MSSFPAPEFKIAVVRPLKFAVCASRAEQSARPETHPVLLHQSPRSRHALAKSIDGGIGVNGGGVGQNTHPVGPPRPASQEFAVEPGMHNPSIVTTPLPQQAGSNAVKSAQSKVTSRTVEVFQVGGVRTPIMEDLDHTTRDSPYTLVREEPVIYLRQGAQQHRMGKRVAGHRASFSVTRGISRITSSTGFAIEDADQPRPNAMQPTASALIAACFTRDRRP